MIGGDGTAGKTDSIRSKIVCKMTLLCKPETHYQQIDETEFKR